MTVRQNTLLPNHSLLVLQYNHQRNVTARHRRIISDHKYMYLLCYDSIYKRRQADGERGHSLFHA
jgi:hypothetical protein